MEKEMTNMKNVKELVQLLQKNFKSYNGFMGVEIDNVKNAEDLFENVKDEILSITEVVEEGDIEDEFGMTKREANGYVKKLKNFLTKYENQC